MAAILLRLGPTVAWLIANQAAFHQALADLEAAAIEVANAPNPFRPDASKSLLERLFALLAWAAENEFPLLAKLATDLENLVTAHQAALAQAPRPALAMASVSTDAVG